MREAPRKSLSGPLPGWITPELIAETRAVWQPYFTEELTDEQAVALLIPVGVLYEILYTGEADHAEDQGDDEDDGDGDEEVHRARPRQQP